MLNLKSRILKILWLQARPRVDLSLATSNPACLLCPATPQAPVTHD